MAGRFGEQGRTCLSMPELSHAEKSREWLSVQREHGGWYTGAKGLRDLCEP